jgi:hypothetical protein
MTQRSPVDCTAFRKNPDGSWETTKVTDIQGPVGAIRLQPGTVFKKGGRINSVEVVPLLEQYCAG